MLNSVFKEVCTISAGHVWGGEVTGFASVLGIGVGVLGSFVRIPMRRTHS